MLFWKLREIAESCRKNAHISFDAPQAHGRSCWRGKGTRRDPIRNEQLGNILFIRTCTPFYIIPRMEFRLALNPYFIRITTSAASSFWLQSTNSVTFFTSSIVSVNMRPGSGMARRTRQGSPATVICQGGNGWPHWLPSCAAHLFDSIFLNCGMCAFDMRFSNLTSVTQATRQYLVGEHFGRDVDITTF